MNYPCDSERCGRDPCRCEENDFRYSMELGNALRDPHIPDAESALTLTNTQSGCRVTYQHQ